MATHSSAAQRSAALAVLGLPSQATAEQVKQAYRTLARATHPDVIGHDDGDARSRFSAITLAYQVLAEGAETTMEPSSTPAGAADPTSDTAEAPRARVPATFGRRYPHSPIVAGPVTVTPWPAGAQGERPKSGGRR